MRMMLRRTYSSETLPKRFSSQAQQASAAFSTVLLNFALAWLITRKCLVLLTFLQFAYQAVGYRPDQLFSLWIGAGLFAYAAGAGQRPRWWLRVAGFALLGLAVLAKGPLGLLLPGMTPDAMGEVYVYNPSLNGVVVAAGVWGVGALLFTLMAKVAMAVTVGDMRYRPASPGEIGYRAT